MNRALYRLSACAVIACSAALGYGYAAQANEPALKIVKISAHRYVFVPDHITLKKGETAQFELVSEDVPMGFSLPDFAVRATVVPGETARLTLTPQKTGTFTFLCDVFCGSGHESMDGVLTVLD